MNSLLFEAKTSKRSDKCLNCDVVPALLVPAIIALGNTIIACRRLSGALRRRKIRQGRCIDRLRCNFALPRFHKGAPSVFAMPSSHNCAADS